MTARLQALWGSVPELVASGWANQADFVMAVERTIKESTAEAFEEAAKIADEWNDNEIIAKMIRAKAKEVIG